VRRSVEGCRGASKSGRRALEFGGVSRGVEEREERSIGKRGKLWWNSKESGNTRSRQGTQSEQRIAEMVFGAYDTLLQTERIIGFRLLGERPLLVDVLLSMADSSMRSNC